MRIRGSDEADGDVDWDTEALYQIDDGIQDDDIVNNIIIRSTAKKYS